MNGEPILILEVGGCEGLAKFTIRESDIRHPSSCNVFICIKLTEGQLCSTPLTLLHAPATCGISSNTKGMEGLANGETQYMVGRLHISAVGVVLGV
jgi:hypothetical protein